MFGGAGLESEGVGAGGGFGEGVGADGAGGQFGEVVLLLRVVGPADEGVDAEGVLDVDEDADGGVDGGDGFDGEDGLEEGAGGAAVLLGNLDAEEAEAKSWRMRPGSICWASSMARTRGAICSTLNWRTVSRKSCSSSESWVRAAGFDCCWFILSSVLSLPSSLPGEGYPYLFWTKSSHDWT